MDCCQCQGIETEFDRRFANRKLKHYREKGLKKETKILFDALVAENIEGYSILDIGGGIGTLEFALLDEGAIQATNVEASSASIAAAQEEASRQGKSDQITIVHGDFVQEAGELANADVVTLDKVVCCYGDMKSLVTLSVEKAEKLYGLIYPRDAWWVKAAIWAGNMFLRVKGSDFRAFVHPTNEVEQIVKGRGMKKVFATNHTIWQIVVYKGQA